MSALISPQAAAPRRSTLLLAAIPTALVAAYAVWILAGRYDALAEEYVSTGLMLLLCLAGTILGLRVVLQRDGHPRLRLGWLLIVAALISYATAEAIWFVEETLSGLSPFPSWADLFYLLFYPLLIAGVASMPYAPVSRVRRIALWLDLGIVFCVALMFFWFFLLEPTQSSHADAPTAFLAIAYPLADLLLLAALVWIVERDLEAGRRGMLLLLAGSLLLSLVPDSLFAYFEVHGLAHEAPRLNLIWLLSVLLIVFAAAWQSLVQPRRVAWREVRLGPFGRWMRFILPVLAIGIGYGLLVAIVYRMPTAAAGVVGVAQLGLALTLLVMARQFLAIHEATRLYEVARGQAIRDSLTGAFNRRFFDEVLDREVERAHRYAQPLSVIVLDLNGFKAYNDTYGHPAGDEVLREVAHSLTGSVRSADVVARYGGDEFGLILPQADTQAAQRVTQRICTAIHLAQTAVHGITLSAGMATLREGMTARDLVAEADRAMYLQRAEQRSQAVARPADR